jgi:hypothetical protein
VNPKGAPNYSHNSIFNEHLSVSTRNFPLSGGQKTRNADLLLQTRHLSSAFVNTAKTLISALPAVNIFFCFLQPYCNLVGRNAIESIIPLTLCNSFFKIFCILFKINVFRPFLTCFSPDRFSSFLVFLNTFLFYSSSILCSSVFDWLF